MPYWRLFYHLIWSTHGREPLITPQLEPIVHRQLRQIAQHHGIGVYAVGGVENHVHMAVLIPPSLAVSAAIKRIKGSSSHAISQTTEEPFAWQGAYGVETFAERSLPLVVAYITEQHRHHADGSLWSTIESISPHSDEGE